MTHQGAYDCVPSSNSPKLPIKFRF